MFVLLLFWGLSLCSHFVSLWYFVSFPSSWCCRFVSLQWVDWLWNNMCHSSSLSVGLCGLSNPRLCNGWMQFQIWAWWFFISVHRNVTGSCFHLLPSNFSLNLQTFWAAAWKLLLSHKTGSLHQPPLGVSPTSPCNLSLPYRAVCHRWISQHLHSYKEQTLQWNIRTLRLAAVSHARDTILCFCWSHIIKS